MVVASGGRFGVSRRLSARRVRGVATGCLGLFGRRDPSRGRRFVVLTVVTALAGTGLVVVGGGGVATAGTGFGVIGHFGGVAGSGNGQFSSPAGVAVDQASGDVYVADPGNHRVQKFDATGNFLLAFGSAGSSPGQFANATAIAVDNSVGGPASGDVYVADQGNNVVDQFSSTGTFIGQVADAPGTLSFGSPVGLSVDPNGNLWVVGSGNNADEFDNTGKFVTGFNDTYGTTSAIAVDSKDNVYLIRGTGATERWTSAGTGQTVIDESSPGSDSSTGTGLAVNQATDAVYIDDTTYVAAYDSAGNKLAQFGQLTGGAGIAVNSATGALYVVDAPNNVVDIFGQGATFPDVTTGAASGISQTGATVGGTINPEGVDTTYHFDYGTDTTYAGGSTPD